MDDVTYVGLDTHKVRIYVAVLFPGREKAVEWDVANDAASVRGMVKKIVREAPGQVHFCYEAGPCGYVLQRQIEAASDRALCVVVAPSLIPRKPGDRIKTDRRDARKLAELHRAGLLTEVVAPTPEDEAVRDLVRAREDAKQDQTRCRHRLGKMLLRRGLGHPGKRSWTQAHWRWLKSLRFDDAADQVVLDDYLLALEQIDERLRGLETHIGLVAQRERYAAHVGWLRCFRGIDTLTAISILAELHDFTRFRTARHLMAYLGLVPSEYSSGDRLKRGRITGAGNQHVRRLLVEAAWHYRHRPSVAAIEKRRKGQPAGVIAIADRAQQRLHRRFHRMVMTQGKPSPKAVVAVARELAGFIWAAMQHVA
jgi:transposase